jgi:hypothetical protein
MFNEGVDLPDVDTILMLRPTESRILWLQQFGRGLRYRPEKTLKVVDYIGNHRVFLTKTRALLNLGDANRDVAYALDQYQDGTLDLPPGCSVTYDLEAIEMLRGLIKPTGATDALEQYYEETRDRLGRRPLAREVFQDGYNPRSARQHYGSWLGFVRHMGDFTPEQEQAWSTLEPFLTQLETTPMHRSYNMVLLEAMLGADALPGQIPIDSLAERFGEIARRYAAVRTEVGAALDDPESMRRLLEKNPIDAWTGGQGTGGVTYFEYDNGVLRTTAALDVPAHLRPAAQDLIWELVDWRFATYLRRAGGGASADTITCAVSQDSGRPMLSLPDRNRHVGIPEGWRDVLVNGKERQAKFGKSTIDVVTRPGSEENILSSIVQEWFGPDAGKPGRADQVVFQRRGMDYAMVPAREAERSGPVLWQRFKRADVQAALSFEFKGRENQRGVVQRPGAIILFVTLDKTGKPKEHKYRDKFLSPTGFEWQSQNITRQSSELGRDIYTHKERGIDVHLFVRRTDKVRGKTQMFIYCGTLEFQRWEGERPITVWWQLSQAVPEDLWDELGVPSADGRE